LKIPVRIARKKSHPKCKEYMLLMQKDIFNTQILLSTKYKLVEQRDSKKDEPPTKKRTLQTDMTPPKDFFKPRELPSSV
jgi:hypothetical protein